MPSDCRHVLSNSRRCTASAMNGSPWCYFHTRLHKQNAQRAAREADRRSRDARRQPRLTDGTFAPPEETLDQGNPVGGEKELVAPASSSIALAYEAEAAPLRLPDVEDPASIQLALIEVIHALAANQIEPRRASLILYALQVASANVKSVHVVGSVSSIGYTEEGIAFCK